MAKTVWRPAKVQNTPKTTSNTSNSQPRPKTGGCSSCS